MKVRRPGGALLLAGLLTVAACGGGDDAADPTTTVATTVATTAATTTSSSTTTTTTTPPTTAAPTTVPAPPTMPLTGVVTDTVPARPALVVKIDNHQRAVPQTGLNQADVVYEEQVEGITRFFAIFHSQGSVPVGPIRSARTSDIDLLAMLGQPILAWSGGNPFVNNAVAQSNAIDAGAPNHFGAGYFRDKSRRAPHNLYSSTDTLWQVMSPPDAVAPLPLFRYRAAGATPTGLEPGGRLSVTMGLTPFQWAWDPATGTWLRSQYGREHKDSSGARVSAENVVVQFTDYRPSPADARSPEAITVGGGEAWVFTAGGLVRGRWDRPAATAPARLLDASGNEIQLTPGRTWVELAPPGSAQVTP